MHVIDRRATLGDADGQLPEQTFRTICDHIPNLVSIYNVQSNRYVYVNQAIKPLLGYAKSEWVGSTLRFISELVHPEDQASTRAAYKKILHCKDSDKKLSKDPVASVEYRMQHKNGEWIWLKTDVRVLTSKKGKVETILNESVDITELKKASTQLKLSKMRYQAFIQNSSEGIWRIELDRPIPIGLSVDEQIHRIFTDGYMAEANNAMAEMYGLKTVKGLIGARLSELLPEADPANRAYLRSFVATGYRLANAESHEVDSNGNDHYFVNSLVGIVKDSKLWRAWGTQRDITEQRQVEIGRSKTEGRLALALETTKLGFWEWDVASDKLMWSSQLKKIYGLKESDQVDYQMYLSFIHPDDLHVLQRTVDQAFKDQNPYQIEHRIVWRDGSVHWVDSHGQAILVEGKPAVMLGTCVNIDDRKAAEKLKVEAALLGKERQELIALNAAKDEFIAVASHQLRTPATGVKQYIGMLLEGYFGEISSQQRQSLEKAYISNERQIKIINDLLMVASIDAGKIQLSKNKIDVSKLVADIAEEQKTSTEQRHQKIILKLPKTCVIKADQRYLRMVIENLVNNASKYSADGTTVKITVTTGTLTATIAVADQGVGVSKADQERLFQKFSRIDNERSAMVEGTGLGLYWAKKIIELHQGKLLISSQPNKGSTFSVRLPL